MTMKAGIIPFSLVYIITYFHFLHKPHIIEAIHQKNMLAVFPSYQIHHMTITSKGLNQNAIEIDTDVQFEDASLYDNVEDPSTLTIHDEDQLQLYSLVKPST